MTAMTRSAEFTCAVIFPMGTFRRTKAAPLRVRSILVSPSNLVVPFQPPMSNNRDHQLKDLCDRALLIVGFMSGVSPSDPFLKATEDAINAAFIRRDLGGLKTIQRDLREWVRDLSPDGQEQLQELLSKHFGPGSTDESSAVASGVASILQRGSIQTEEEYRLLLERAEEIYADESRPSADLASINRLLTEYESRMRPPDE